MLIRLRLVIGAFSAAILLAAWTTAISANEDADTRISAAVQDEDGVLVHKVRSIHQAQTTQIRVLLPDDMAEGRKYRVLFVLPVEAGNSKSWGDGLDEAKKNDLHNRHDLICVAPTFSELPWYADHATSSTIRQESYLLKDVVPYIDQTYPTIANSNGRLLVGFSKSGWGAFSLLMRNPTVFGKAAAWDAPLMMEQPNKYGMGPIFGSQENFEHYQLSRLVEENRDSFRRDTRLLHFGYGGFRTHHEQMEKLLAKHKISHHYQDGPERKHAWDSGWLSEAVDGLASTSNPVPKR